MHDVFRLELLYAILPILFLKVNASSYNYKGLDVSMTK